MKRVIKWGDCPESRRNEIRRAIRQDDKRTGEKLRVKIEFHGAGKYGAELFNASGKCVAVI